MKKSLLLSFILLFASLFTVGVQAKGFYGEDVSIKSTTPKTKKLTRKERRALKKQRRELLKKRLVDLKKRIKEAKASLPTRAERKHFTKAERKEYRQKKRSIRKAKRLYAALKMYADTGTLVLAVVLWFFLGALGIHRLAFKASPIVIVGYFFTFGGFFGLIPLIDLFHMLINPAHYEGNSKLFAAFGAK